jgi:hypothetical protein
MSLDALRRGLISLYDADSQVQAITGRTEGNLVLRGTDEEANLPVATYFIVSATEPGGTSQRERVIVQFDFWVTLEDNNTPSDLHTLMDRGDAVWTSTNFAGLGTPVDVAVFKGTFRDGISDAASGLISIGRDYTFELAT